MIAQRERGVVSESAGTRKSLCVWQLQNASVLNVDWISAASSVLPSEAEHCFYLSASRNSDSFSFTEDLHC